MKRPQLRVHCPQARRSSFYTQAKAPTDSHRTDATPQAEKNRYAIAFPLCGRASRSSGWKYNHCLTVGIAEVDPNLCIRRITWSS